MTACIEKEIETQKAMAIIADGAASQIIIGVSIILGSKKEPLSLKKLYPALFGDNKKKANILNSIEAQEMIWRNFLGIKAGEDIGNNS